MSDEYEICLKPNAKPHALFRQLDMYPYPSERKCEQSFKEHRAYISKVDQPTPWCAGMGVWNQWNGMLEWNTGMEYWNDILD